MNEEEPVGEWSPESLLARAGCRSGNDGTGIVQPVHLATTYQRAADGSYPGGNVYGRMSNPNRHELEQLLARLEGAACGFAFSSGMAAATSILLALPGNCTTLFPHDVFHGIRKLCERIPGLSVDAEYVDYRNRDDVEAALKQSPTLVWIETPSNPMLRITDIAAVSSLAHQQGALVVVDGTWTSPLLQTPLELGADLVFHSLTKYYSGHSDVLGGAVLCREQNNFAERIGDFQSLAGNPLDPFSCWLTLRGMRTLPLRMARHCESATQIADFLDNHPKVTRVHFPGLKSHRSHDLASQQMKLFGGMLSFEVDGGSSEAMAFAARLRLITRATSLGATESLIEHRASIEGPGTTTPDNLLRLSVGLESPKDLIRDLDNALRS